MLEGNYERKIGLEEVWIVDWFRGEEMLGFIQYVLRKALSRNKIILNNPTIQKYNTACNTTFNMNITFYGILNSRGNKKKV